MSVVYLSGLTGCQIKETMYLQQDGSCKLEAELDFGKMLKTMEEQFGAGNDAKEEKRDTMIDVSALLMTQKDSIAKLPEEDRKQLEKIMKSKMKLGVHSDKSKNEMSMNFSMEFDNVAQMSDYPKLLKAGQKTSGLSMSKAGPQQNEPETSKTSYSFDGTTFKRMVTELELTAEEMQAVDAGMVQKAPFYQGVNYIIEYHFPRAIKSTTAKGATFSEGKKVLHLEVPFIEFSKDPKVLDFEVVLVD